MCRRFRTVGVVGIGLALWLAVQASLASAATYYWNANTSAFGAQDGSGTWIAGGSNWTQTASNGTSTAWSSNVGTGDTAIFGYAPAASLPAP